MSLQASRGRIPLLHLRQPLEKPRPPATSIHADVLDLWDNRRCWICKEMGLHGFGICSHRETTMDLAEIAARREHAQKFKRRHV